MPSAEVNSVMISPHPPRFRIKRRKTVSVTPAMGASTVAGAIRTFPIVKHEGTGTACVARGPPSASRPELAQYLRTLLFYLSLKKTRPLPKQGPKIRADPRKSVARSYFLTGSALAYFRRKRSTRPAVSISFCLPVKKGWHAEQISTWISPLWVERVVKLLPQAHITRI